MSATAEQVPEPDLDRGLAVYSDVSEAQGLPPWNRSDVSPPAKHRLYRAAAVEHFLLSATDERLPVDLG
jgi:hypothetical protein